MLIFIFFRIYAAPPTAELEPLSDGQLAQTDEVTKHIRLQTLIKGHIVHPYTLLTCGLAIVNIA